MNCPRCNEELVLEDYMGIEVDKCPGCEGMWLDYHELDELEDKVYAEDELKGTTVYRSFPSNMNCPKCGKQMNRFNYRFYDLELDYCDDEHGWWLDKGEEERVLEVMQQKAKDLERKFSWEEKWPRFLRGLRSKGKKGRK
jgi:Zn-finger nucleic acid-binding protein